MDDELDFYNECFNKSVRYEDLIDEDNIEALSMLEESPLIQSDLLFRRFHLEVNCMSKERTP